MVPFVDLRTPLTQTAGSSTVEGVDLFVNCASNSSIPPQPNRRRRRSFTASQNTLLF